MDAVIETFDLNKSYKTGNTSIGILHNINISISKGEFISIMGPSGSGKSTLLYLLGGLDKPTSGIIKIQGRNISGFRDKAESEMRRKNIGFIFQFYNLIPNLSIQDNILLPVLLDGKNPKKYHDKLYELLDYIRLSHRKKHTPRELSGGEQQRVAIARALINDPDIILADEPTGNLDTATSTDILNLMRKVNDEKSKTIVMVTHSNEAAEYSKSHIVLRDGRIIERSP